MENQPTELKKLANKISGLEDLIRGTLIPIVSEKFDQLEKAQVQLEKQLRNTESRLITEQRKIEERLGNTIAEEIAKLHHHLVTEFENRLLRVEHQLGLNVTRQNP